MDDKQAKRLGAFLRKQREALNLSARQLAEQCGLPHTTVSRIEEGAFTAPSPDKLSRIAEALDLSLADVYSLADYALPKDLPSPTLYLRTKFRDMSNQRLRDLSRDIEATLRRHGVDPNSGPKEGEDETPRGPRTPKKPSTTTKKGGTR